MERILLLRHDKAGDAIKTLPALRALKALGLPAEWHILCSPHNASLFETEAGFRRHVLPEDWQTRELGSLKKSLAGRGIPLTWDRVINLLCDPFPESDRLMNLFNSPKKFSVPQSVALPLETPAGRDERQNIAHILSQAMGVSLIPAYQSFSSAPHLLEADHAEAREKMGDKSGTWLGICPLAGTTHRTHPYRRWERFVRKITRKGHYSKVFLFGTPRDFPLLNQIKEATSDPQKVELCFPSHFRALGAYLMRLDGVIAVDSGPLHLAHALGIQTLGILSGGDRHRWFAQLGTNDYLLPRGLWDRYPWVFEMTRAYAKWRSLGIPDMVRPAWKSVS